MSRLRRRYVLLALAQSGRSDIVCEMARQTDHPSYGYQIVHGATTLTEAWDGPTVGKSQNHFMLGHLEEWLYAGLAGIDYRYDPDFESYRVSIKPFVPEGMEEVTAEHRLPAGRIRAAWKRIDRNRLSLDADIPADCTGEIYVPALSIAAITESGAPIAEAEGVEAVRLDNGYVVLLAGSGQYRFVSEEVPL